MSELINIVDTEDDAKPVEPIFLTERKMQALGAFMIAKVAEHRRERELGE